MVAGSCLDQLACDTNAARSTADAAFQHIANAKLSANLTYIYRTALVGEGRVASDHKQPSGAGECCGDVLGNTIRKILLLQVTAYVLKWQNSN
jgi:hypothetical protein